MIGSDGGSDGLPSMSVSVPEVSVSSSDQVFRTGAAPKAAARGASGTGASASSTTDTEKLPAAGVTTSEPAATTPSRSPSGKTTDRDRANGPSGAESAAARSSAAPSSPLGTSPVAPGAAPAPAPGAADAAPAAAVDPGPRTVRLTLARVDPLSTLKLSFLLSVALGIGLVMATVVLWQLLNQMGVFSSLNETLQTVDSGGASSFDLYDYIGLSRVVSLATFIAVMNVVLLMALAAAGAVLYNIAASLVGGLHITLSDD